ncbi:hypothetical protein F4553_001231 [Allocatelliglobosispora scoriae]|uniref:Roadblock/LAMTOR2 domain-containing protein n=1 Tax=Allocatelliglobosispora scoriae TaxID=643052 RepID=A0A841BM70_9ACTN|nr:hypothetical protein [Allocatelliglobosispora scoriae]MBB5867852.1 hypothetical protein [Allocatelliglobosispora scoriae]
MTDDDPSGLQEQSKTLERAISKAQLQLSDILYRYKTDNGAIKHLAIYNLQGILLAYTPDEEVQNVKLLEAQYDWLAQIIGPAIGSINAACEDFAKFSKRRVPRDFGRPKVLRIQTDEGDAVSQIYAIPIDPRALIFVVVTARAATRRQAFVANEALLLDDMYGLIREILALLGATDGLSA